MHACVRRALKEAGWRIREASVSMRASSWQESYGVREDWEREREIRRMG
jgi:hypothetical protein